MKWIAAFFVLFSAHGQELEKLATDKSFKTICEEMIGGVQDGRLITRRPRFAKLKDRLFVFQSHPKKAGFNVTIFSESETQKKFLDQPRYLDITASNKFLWLAKPYSVLKLDIETFEVLDELEIVPSEHQHKNFRIRSLIYQNGLLYTVHGLGGLIAFNPEKRKRVFNHELNIRSKGSMAVSLTGDGRRIFVAMASAGPKGFSGLVALDGLRMIGEARYNHKKWGYVSVTPQMDSQRDFVVLNNGGWVHVISKKDILTNQKISPKWLAIKGDTPEGEIYKMFQGEILMDDSHVLGCSSLTYGTRGEMNRRGEVFFKSL